MTLWQIALLAVFQGATEFIPVSSSGHLVLVRNFFGWSDADGLFLDTVLHAGSLAAVLIYFRRDWVEMLRALFFRGRGEGRAPDARRLLLLLVLATLPIVAAGPLLDNVLEDHMRGPAAVGIAMLLTALFFLVAERRHGESAHGGPQRRLHALLVGCAQVMALAPGASRSGWTASAGMLCGWTRMQAVRFAFLLSVPAIAGAMIFKFVEALGVRAAGFNTWHLCAGFVISLATSLAAIHFCLKFFREHSLRPFAGYLALLGAAALVFSLVQ